jgi:hypothetical protein
MDYTSPAISLLILMYGVGEYRRRKKRHAVAMEQLTRGEFVTDSGSQLRSWKLAATVSACVLLAGCVSMLLYTGAHAHNSSAILLEIMACVIAVPLLILVVIVVRDIRRYRGSRQFGKESEG